MALLHLVARWAGGHGVQVHAATVDHGLREGSEAEARQVGQWCGALGISHTTLRWVWDGQGNLQDAARRGRRRTMAAWAQARQITDICLGHTCDDQAETVVMRLQRGSGVDGLAGMPAVRIEDGVNWLRPMLGLSRASLRDWLRAERIGWIDDPSNDDTRFDRVAARQAIEVLNLDQGRLARTAMQMSAAASVLRQAAVALAEQAVTQEGNDLIVSRAKLRGAPHDTRWRVVAGALQYVGQREYRPRFDALTGFTEALLTGEGRTLHGVRSQTAGKTAMRLSTEHGGARLAPNRDNFHHWLAMH